MSELEDNYAKNQGKVKPVNNDSNLGESAPPKIMLGKRKIKQDSIEDQQLDPLYEKQKIASGGKNTTKNEEEPKKSQSKFKMIQEEQKLKILIDKGSIHVSSVNQSSLEQSQKTFVTTGTINEEQESVINIDDASYLQNSEIIEMSDSEGQ